ncbi:MAG: sel1 repeat family protein [Bacteroidales bacterium]|nr:sel1 repeat family protein [Bacteroidales bacterium]
MKNPLTEGLEYLFDRLVVYDAYDEDDDETILDDLDYTSNDEDLEKLKELAEKGNARAQDELGDYYWMEDDDAEKAFYWFKKSAEQKYPQGMTDLGRCYIGAYDDSHIDYEKAVAVLTEAAELGCADAYWYLSECYAKGLGVRKDMKKAKKLYNQAMELGSDCDFEDPWDDTAPSVWKKIVTFFCCK